MAWRNPANNVITRGQLDILGIDLDQYNRILMPDPDPNQLNADLLRGLQGLRTLAIRLPQYDSSQLVTDWLADFDRYAAETGRTSDDNKLFDLISHLDPEAKQWYQLLPDATKGDYAQLRAAFQERFSPTSQEILDLRGALYTMKQSPTQKYRDFVREVQQKARAIALPDAEVLGICISGALPTLKPHLAMAKAATTSELLKLPIVVSDMVTTEDPTLSMLQILNDKLDLVSVNQATQATQRKSVSFARTDRSPSPGPSHSQGRRPPSAHRSPSPSPQGFQPPHRWRQSPVPQSPHQGRSLRSSQWQPQGPSQWHPPGPSQWQPQGQSQWQPQGQSQWQPRGPSQWQPQGRYRPLQYPSRNSNRPSSLQNCSKCGQRCMGSQECPAFGRECFHCGGLGHFRRMCRSRRVTGQRYNANGR